MQLIPGAPPMNDEQLIERHLTGDPSAFREIVERHQAMVCAVAYSACGDLTRSEDVAQETFVAAWKQLAQLRERAKFRAWLGGIARNLANNYRRQSVRAGIVPTEASVAEAVTDEPDPREQATQADRTELMWRALAEIPTTYREPMVLFYREQRSHAAVAAALDVSEETARQRLVRGRAMLTERMAAMVEEALEHSAPKPALVGSVLGAIAVLTGPGAVTSEAAEVAAGATAKFTAAAGVAGSLASKGGVATKVFLAVGLVPAVFLGWMDFLKFRAAYEAAKPGLDRQRLLERALRPVLLGAMLIGLLSAQRLLFQVGGVFEGASTRVRLGTFAGLAMLVLAVMVLSRRRLARQEATAKAAAEGGHLHSAGIGKVRYEYRSTHLVLGLPLVHIHVGGEESAMRRRARAWVALSDGIAVGGMFAAGGQLAVAPLSVGPVALGAVSFGVVSAGLAALGGVAAGVYAYGAAAFGWIAAKGAILARAGEFAQGQTAFAVQANDAGAGAYFDSQWFFRGAEAVCAMGLATAFYLWVVPLLLMGGYFWLSRKKSI